MALVVGARIIKITIETDMQVSAAGAFIAEEDFFSVISVWQNAQFIVALLCFGVSEYEFAE